MSADPARGREDAGAAGEDACYAPGSALPILRRKITQPMIDKYAQASGDLNPIHVDPEYSRKGPYGRTIAHGLMTLTLAAQALNEWSAGEFDVSGEIEVAFLGPVFTEDTIEISGVVEEIVEREGQSTARASISCMAGERKIMAGTVFQPIESKR